MFIYVVMFVNPFTRQQYLCSGEAVPKDLTIRLHWFYFLNTDIDDNDYK